jgi:hypothetical protein
MEPEKPEMTADEIRAYADWLDGVEGVSQKAIPSDRRGLIPRALREMADRMERPEPSVDGIDHDNCGQGCPDGVDHYRYKWYAEYGRRKALEKEVAAINAMREAPAQPAWTEPQIRAAVRLAVWEDYPEVKGDIDDFNADTIANWTITRLKAPAQGEKAVDDHKPMFTGERCDSCGKPDSECSCPATEDESLRDVPHTDQERHFWNGGYEECYRQHEAALLEVLRVRNKYEFGPYCGEVATNVVQDLDVPLRAYYGEAWGTMVHRADLQPTAQVGGSCPALSESGARCKLPSWHDLPHVYPTAQADTEENLHTALARFAKETESLRAEVASLKAERDAAVAKIARVRECVAKGIPPGYGLDAALNEESKR